MEDNNIVLKGQSTKIAGPENFKDAEWVFQFDDEKPVVFAWSDSSEEPGDITITLKPNEKSRITFTNVNGTKIMSLYSRPITEETIKARRNTESQIK
jgi:hypothetical protein